MMQSNSITLPVEGGDPLEFFASVSDHIGGFFFRCFNDKDYSMQRLTSGFDRLTGYASADFVLRGEPFAPLIHKDDIAQVVDVVNRAVEACERYRVMYRLRTKARAYSYVLEHGGGVYEPQTGLLRYLDGVVLDAQSLT